MIAFRYARQRTSKIKTNEIQKVPIKKQHYFIFIYLFFNQLAVAICFTNAICRFLAYIQALFAYKTLVTCNQDIFL